MLAGQSIGGGVVLITRAGQGIIEGLITDNGEAILGERAIIKCLVSHAAWRDADSQRKARKRLR